MALRINRILIVALAFILASLYHMISLTGEKLMRALNIEIQNVTTAVLTANNNNNDDILSQPRLGYVRPPGNHFELLGIFESISDPELLADKLPKTAKEIAERYGIPKTPRDVQCHPDNMTRIGWIPKKEDSTKTNNATTEDDVPYKYTGKIPNLIFQSWKSNQLGYKICSNILEWTIQNPEYDYFLFDDAAIDAFIKLEYGPEIFSSYACVKVGAAKCDVWRLLIIYLFGGIYFDADVKPLVRFADWKWGDKVDVVTGRSCTSARKKHPGGCAHQWGLIYAPRHPVIHAAITETITNLAERKATNVYDISFWSYYHAWRNGPYNQSYMPGWGEAMGGRVLFQDNEAKAEMRSENGHWPGAKQMWHDECIVK